jgi:thiol-disulfide isomerase/thioredoxin
VNARSHLALSAFLLAVAPTLACQGKTETKVTNAKAAPSFSGTTLDGDEFDLAALQGKVVMLNMWATWCEPCREELPELSRLHQEHQSEGFSVVGVNVDVRRMEKKVRRMAADFELPFPVVLDQKNASVRAFEVVGYPTTFIVGRDGSVRWRRDGMIFKNDAEVAEVLAAALAEK